MIFSFTQRVPQVMIDHSREDHIISYHVMEVLLIRDSRLSKEAAPIGPIPRANSIPPRVAKTSRTSRFFAESDDNSDEPIMEPRGNNCMKLHANGCHRPTNGINRPNLPRKLPVPTSSSRPPLSRFLNVVFQICPYCCSKTTGLPLGLPYHAHHPCGEVSNSSLPDPP